MQVEQKIATGTAVDITLLKVDGQWKIMNKVFNLHP